MFACTRCIRNGFFPSRVDVIALFIFFICYCSIHDTLFSYGARKKRLFCDVVRPSAGACMFHDGNDNVHGDNDRRMMTQDV